MPSNYQVFHRKQDIGKRISQLHREEQLAVGIVATGSVDELTDAVSACVNAVRWPVSVIMYEEMGRVVELRSMFPQVTFIVFQNPVTMGTKLNAMADECYTTYFFIIRSDQRILAFNDEELFALLRRSDRPAAVVPTLVNRNGEPMPSIQAPMVREGMVDPMPFFPSTAIIPTLYPFLGWACMTALCSNACGGFDENIVSDYWQFLISVPAVGCMVTQFFVTRALPWHSPAVRRLSRTVPTNRAWSDAPPKPWVSGRSTAKIIRVNTAGTRCPFVEDRSEETIGVV